MPPKLENENENENVSVKLKLKRYLKLKRHYLDPPMDAGDMEFERLKVTNLLKHWCTSALAVWYSARLASARSQFQRRSDSDTSLTTN